MFYWVVTIFLCWLLADPIMDFFHYCRIQVSAYRLGLRDRGEVEHYTNSEGRSFFFAHEICNTRSRIGITKEGTPVVYCWRCEVITDDTCFPNPDGGESLPTDQNGTVIPFPTERVRKAS